MKMCLMFQFWRGKSRRSLYLYNNQRPQKAALTEGLWVLLPREWRRMIAVGCDGRSELLANLSNF